MILFITCLILVVLTYCYLKFQPTIDRISNHTIIIYYYNWKGKYKYIILSI